MRPQMRQSIVDILEKNALLSSDGIIDRLGPFGPPNMVMESYLRELQRGGIAQRNERGLWSLTADGETEKTPAELLAADPDPEPTERSVTEPAVPPVDTPPPDQPMADSIRKRRREPRQQIASVRAPDSAYKRGDASNCATTSNEIHHQNGTHPVNRLSPGLYFATPSSNEVDQADLRISVTRTSTDKKSDDPAPMIQGTPPTQAIPPTQAVSPISKVMVFLRDSLADTMCGLMKGTLPNEAAIARAAVAQAIIATFRIQE